jgi:hypothetical protein
MFIYLICTSPYGYLLPFPTAIQSKGPTLAELSLPILCPRHEIFLLTGVCIGDEIISGHFSLLEVIYSVCIQVLAFTLRENVPLQDNL